MLKQYKDRLDEFKLEFQDYVQRPSKYGPVKTDIIIDNLFNKEKERNWKLVNLKQQNDFLSDTHSTFEAMIITKRNKMKRFLEPIEIRQRSVSTTKA